MKAAALIAPLNCLLAMLPGMFLLDGADGKRQELLTAFWKQNRDDGASSNIRPLMSLQPTPLSDTACMLVVGLPSDQRELLRQSCADRWTGLRLEFVASFADAVMRLACGGVDVVLLDLRQLATLSSAAPLVLRGIAPDARLLSLGGSVSRSSGGIESLADETALLAWLQRQQPQA